MRKKNIKSPDHLKMLFAAYRKYHNDHPRILHTGYGPIKRWMSWKSFYSFLSDKGIASTLKDYKSNRDNRYTEYKEVIAYVA